jgi:hypothetical protein
MTSVFEPDEHFHTAARPLDCNGRVLKPLDLVRIKCIPSHNFTDPDFAILAEYSGCYGLVTYCMKEPWYFGRSDHPGWVSSDGAVVCVLTRRINGNRVTSWEFWLPEQSVEWLPYNSLIMDVFAEYPWEMADANGNSKHFVIAGMEQFAHIKKVLDAPYETLVKAHAAAALFLSTT